MKFYLALAVLIPAVLFTLACSSSATNDSQSVPANNSQGIATVIPVTTGTTELRPGGTPTPNVALTPASSTPSTGASNSASGATVTVTFPFVNAEQATLSLLGNAQLGGKMDPLDRSDPVDPKAYPGWNLAYPTLRIVGYGVNATPSTVSVYRGALNDKDPASASNPKVIAFALTDTKGACGAGVVRGFPTYSEYRVIDIGTAACNGQSVLNVLRR